MDIIYIHRVLYQQNIQLQWMQMVDTDSLPPSHAPAQHFDRFSIHAHADGYPSPTGLESLVFWALKLNDPQ